MTRRGSRPGRTQTLSGADRAAQLEYSALQPAMLDEMSRRRKASKLIRVIEHFRGGSGLQGLTALDIGCSTGYISDELHRSGADVTGIDIDAPGIDRARARFGSTIRFLESSGGSLPAPDASVDVIVFNHIYEHTVDPTVLMAEIRRALKPEGLVYLGLGNRFGIVEPHHKLPFLSWLPKSAADRYVRASGRGAEYYEQLRSRRELRRMCAGLQVWDYTYSVLAEPAAFAADDIVSGRLRAVPPIAWRVLTPILPTYIWIGTIGAASPAGPQLRVPPVAL